MEVRELMTPSPEACLPDDSCVTAVDVMWRRRCGFVPVVENRQSMKVVGVVTDRDIALYLAKADKQASRVRLAECMTPRPKTVAPGENLEEAVQIMQTAAVHRLPVVEKERLVGVLSVEDMAVLAHEQWASSGAHLAERQMAEVLEAIAIAYRSGNGNG